MKWIIKAYSYYPEGTPEYNKVEVKSKKVALVWIDSIVSDRDAMEHDINITKVKRS